MTDIYIDWSIAGMPDANDRLAHLDETGHVVIFVGEVPAGVPVDRLPTGRRLEDIPEAVEAGSWRITADPARCGDHRSGLRTLLVGPRPAPSPRPTPRCDAEARDLSTAVLEILGRDVMG